MANRLTNLRVPRVSLVDRAAVRDPSNPSQPRRFVFMKSEGITPDNPKGGGMPPLTEAEKAELDPKVREVVEKAEKEAADALEAQKKAEEQLEKAQAASSADSTGDGKPAGKASDSRDGDDDGGAPSKLNKDDLDPAVAAALAKAEQDAAESREAIKKADERAQKAERIAKEERSERVTAQWIAKAETGEYRGLPGEPKDIGPVMLQLSEAAPEAWAHFEKSVLLPAIGQLREGEILKEQGRGGEGPPPESATAQIQAKAADLMKADSKLTKAEAMERVRKEDPRLGVMLAQELGTAADPANRSAQYR